MPRVLSALFFKAILAKDGCRNRGSCVGLLLIDDGDGIVLYLGDFLSE